MPRRSDLPDLFLMRHGQSEWNLSGRMQGRLDSDLTELGRRQAHQQASILDGAGLPADTEFWTSPQGRARKTADIAFKGRAGQARSDARLAEISVGRCEGLTLPDVEAEFPGFLDGKGPFRWKFEAPGGETFGEICARCQSWLAGLDRPAAVVSHGITLRVIRGLVLGLDIGGMEELPGGQGVVFHLSGGAHHVLGG